ncbi:methionine ABC transporter permease [Celerinatantimonas sp. MCCC 1A17872]|uniref:methionine ABC transporter permease n=1 Tax=Celerinatantimonas sp. MCCC 1A17872 TaxID=3177514 RepID=UPI0038C1020D
MAIDAVITSWLSDIWSMHDDILKATWQTCVMVGISTALATIIGTIIGMALYALGNRSLYYHPKLYFQLDALVSLMRAFPFVILMIALSPLASIIAGTGIGPVAASVTLTIAGIFFFARLVEQNLKEIPTGMIEAATAMGAHPLRILVSVLLVEARASMVLSITVLTISILSYSAAAGMIGGGGLGDLAIRYGYYRYDTGMIVFIVGLLILMVIALQAIGNKIAAHLDKR